MVCKLVDFIVEFKNPSPQIEKFFSDYIYDGTPQISFEISENDIEYETKLERKQYTKFSYELTAMLRKFTKWMIEENAFFLHSALIDVDGIGIAFAAPSGTGKTTHLCLWQQLLGDRLTVVNGDKPIVRFLENEKYPVGYGTPWNGKEMFGINGKTEIRHFCFIERSLSNSCEKLNASDVLHLFFKQIYIPKKDVSKTFKTLQMANMFLNNVTVWKIKCNMDISAAEVAYNTIFKENNDET